MRKIKEIILLLCLFITILAPLNVSLAATTDEATASRARVKQFIYTWNRNFIRTSEQKIIDTLSWLDNSGYFGKTREEKARFLADCRQSDCSIFVEAIADADQIRSVNAASDSEYYKSYNTINAYLSRSGLSPETHLYLYNLLRKAGYYGMTVDQKCQFLHSHLPTNQDTEHNQKLYNALIAVRNAEGTNCSSPFGGASSNGSAQSYVSIPAELSSEIMDELYKDASANAQIWYQIYNETCTKEWRYEWGNKNCLFQKNLWSQKNKSMLYDQLWTDFKVREGEYEFSQWEKMRMEKVWAALSFDEYVKGLGKLKNAGSIGFISDSPLEDILLLVPTAELDAIVYKAFVKFGRAAAVRIFGEPAVIRVTASGTRALAPATKLLERTGGAVKYKYGQLKILYGNSLIVTKRYAGTFEVDLQKIFHRSALSKKIAVNLFGELAEALDNIGNTYYRKFISSDDIVEAIKKIEVMEPNVFTKECKSNADMFCDWSYVDTSFKKIGVKSDVIWLPDKSVASGVRHELLHSKAPLQRRLNYASYRASGENDPWVRLEEGWTDYQAMCADLELGIGEQFGYDEKRIFVAIQQAINRGSYKFGEPIDGGALQDSFFKFNDIRTINAFLGTKDTMENVALILARNNDKTKGINAAIEYLNSLYR